MSTISNKVIFDMPKRFKKVEKAARAKLVEDEPSPEQRRNWLAVHAHNRKGGAFKDRKKEDNKQACRKRVEEGE
jgi:hypothetical protein